MRYTVKELAELSGVTGRTLRYYDREQALAGHLRQLEQQKQRLERLIAAVQLSIRAEKGEIAMQDEAKFAGLKERLLAENEGRYGQELRERYDEETLAASRQRFQGLSEAEYQAMEALGEEIMRRLAQAVRRGEAPEGEAGLRIALLHKEWLGYIWPSYTAQAHAGLAQMYVADQRFVNYYDQQTPGCAQFLSDAILALTGR